MGVGADFIGNFPGCTDPHQGEGMGKYFSEGVDHSGRGGGTKISWRIEDYPWDASLLYFGSSAIRSCKNLIRQPIT